MRRRRAFTLVELLVVIGIIAVLIAILIPGLVAIWERANRVKCAANLRSIGQGTWSYIQDHKQYPRTFYDPRYGPTTMYTPGDINPDPFDPQHRNCTPSAIYLLVRQHYLPREVFLCPSAKVDVRWTWPNLSQLPLDQWPDFSWARPTSSILSYSFASPYPAHRQDQTVTFKPPPNQPGDFALAADANNAAVVLVLPDGSTTPANLRDANSLNHRQKGQNVLYMDGHVAWQETVLCGHDRDNIYASSSLMLYEPTDRYDSVLLPGYGTATN